MNAAISIRPSRDLRSNYSQISALTRQNPVAITVNGKEDTVVMSHETFVNQQNYIAEMEAKLSVYAHLAQAADDVKLGRVQELDAACDDITSPMQSTAQLSANGFRLRCTIIQTVRAHFDIRELSLPISFAMSHLHG